VKFVPPFVTLPLPAGVLHMALPLAAMPVANCGTVQVEGVVPKAAAVPVYAPPVISAFTWLVPGLEMVTARPTEFVVEFRKLRPDREELLTPFTWKGMLPVAPRATFWPLMVKEELSRAAFVNWPVAPSCTCPPLGLAKVKVTPLNATEFKKFKVAEDDRGEPLAWNAVLLPLGAQFAPVEVRQLYWPLPRLPNRRM
jgi:hypothetical protein